MGDTRLNVICFTPARYPTRASLRTGTSNDIVDWREDLEYKSTLAEAKAWLSGWLEGWRVHRDLLHLQRPLAPHLAELLEQ